MVCFLAHLQRVVLDQLLLLADEDVAEVMVAAPLAAVRKEVVLFGCTKTKQPFKLIIFLLFVHYLCYNVW